MNSILRHVALICLAWVHDPCPADVFRFGLRFEPSIDKANNASPARADWRFAAACEQHALKYGQWWRCGECRWRSSVWFYLDDLADSNRHIEARFVAAARLKELLGPLAYYRGDVPAPWSDEQE